MSGGGGRRPWFRGAALWAIGVLLLASVAAGPRPNHHPRRHVVEIRGMTFDPAVLEVQPGDTIVWINRDLFPHTATATRPPGWSTGRLLQGESGSHVPGERGEDPYFCELHPTMKGKLIVR